MRHDEQRGRIAGMRAKGAALVLLASALVAGALVAPSASGSFDHSSSERMVLRSAASVDKVPRLQAVRADRYWTPRARAQRST